MLFWENRKETLSGLLVDGLTESVHSPKSVDCITVTVYKALSFPTTVSPLKLSFYLRGSITTIGTSKNILC